MAKLSEIVIAKQNGQIYIGAICLVEIPLEERYTGATRINTIDNTNLGVLEIDIVPQPTSGDDQDLADGTGYVAIPRP